MHFACMLHPLANFYLGKMLCLTLNEIYMYHIAVQVQIDEKPDVFHYNR